MLRNRNLSLLFAGQFISAVGDAMFHIALMWLVLELTGSKAAMGAVAMAGYLPVLVFGLLGGVLVDLFDRRWLMIGADVVRAAAVGVLLAAVSADAATLPLILGVTLCLSTCGAVFNPARDAMIPTLAGEADLVRSNALIQVSGFGAWVLGPAAGAAIIAWVGLKHVFTIDAATFLVSMVALLLIRAPRVAVPALRATVRGQLADIARYVRADSRLTLLLGITALNNFFIMGPAIVGTPIFIHERLGGGATDYAIVESCLGVGMVAGCGLVTVLRRRLNPARILLLGLMFDGLTHALVYFCDSVGGLMLLLGFHALGIPMIVVCRAALIQGWVDAGRRGRVFSLVNISVVGMTALTTGAVGWLSETVPVHQIFAVFGLCAFACGAIGWCHRGLRES